MWEDMIWDVWCRGDAGEWGVYGAGTEAVSGTEDRSNTHWINPSEIKQRNKTCSCFNVIFI